MGATFSVFFCCFFFYSPVKISENILDGKRKKMPMPIFIHGSLLKYWKEHLLYSSQSKPRVSRFLFLKFSVTQFQNIYKKLPSLKKVASGVWWDSTLRVGGSCRIWVTLHLINNQKDKRSIKLYYMWHHYHYTAWKYRDRSYSHNGSSVSVKVFKIWQCVEI